MGTHALSAKVFKVLALCITFALTFVSLTLATGGAAKAAEGNITDKAGSIVITKLTDPTDAAAAGTSLPVQTPAGARPLSGVKFNIKKVEPINLATSEGWELVSKIQKAINAKPTQPLATTIAEIQDPATQTALRLEEKAPEIVTNDSGQVTYTVPQGELGLYLIEELADPTSTHNLLTKAAPFLVTVPFPATGTGSENGWNYNVHVYPKGTASEVSKTSDNEGAKQVGDNMAWYVAFTIPKLQKDITNFRFEDKIDSGTEYQAVEAKILTPTSGRIFPKDELVAAYKNTDPGQSVDIAFDSVPAAGKVSPLNVTISNSNEVQKLREHVNKQLVVKLTVKVTGVIPDGIANSGGAGKNNQWAKGFFSDADGEKGPFVPSGPGEPDKAKWGSPYVRTFTQPTPGTKRPVDNVKFKVIRYTGDTEDEQAVKQAVAQCQQDLKSAADPTNSKCELVKISDKGEQFTAITRRTSSEYASIDIDLPDGTYYLVMTDPTPGYKWHAPRKFVLEGPGKLTHYDPTNDNPTVLNLTAREAWDIELVRRAPGEENDGLPELPLTGASGQLILAVSGAAVLMGATGTFLVAARRKKNENH